MFYIYSEKEQNPKMIKKLSFKINQRLKEKLTKLLQNRVSIFILHIPAKKLEKRFL